MLAKAGTDAAGLPGSDVTAVGSSSTIDLGVGFVSRAWVGTEGTVTGRSARRADATTARGVAAVLAFAVSGQRVVADVGAGARG